jgi:uncharacterized surface protein with fasciclin (FAS1) repeats
MLKLRPFLLILAALVAAAVPAFAQDSTAEPTVDTAGQATSAPTTDAGANAEAEASSDVQTAHVRVAHLSPDTPPVNIYIDGEPSDIQTIAYPTITGWVEVPVGTYSIAAVPIEEDLDAAVIGAIDLSFAPNAWNTIAAVGSFENGTLSAQLIAEDYATELPAGQSRITLYHAVEGAPDVDVKFADGTVLVQGLSYTGEFSLDVAADTYDIQVFEAGTDNLLLDLADTIIEVGSFYFVGLTGTQDSVQASVAAVGLNQVVTFINGASGDVLETLRADGRFDTLVTAIETAGLEDTLTGEGPVTIFAPVDDAFAAVPAEDLDALLADPEALRATLLYDVVDGSLTSQDVLAATSLQSANGDSFTVTANAEGLFLNDTSQVIIPDIPASNGVIHGINAVLLPSEATP